MEHGEKRLDPFLYKEGELFCESVPLRAIAEAVGTPAYVYSASAIEARYREFDDALSAIPHLVCYSVKANGNLALLEALSALGSGFDIVSGGELFRVMRAGGNPAKVVFSGVGKTAEEIAEALRAGILMINVESAAELEVVERSARELGVRAPISLRVNPDVDPRTHPYIATGLRDSKFGLPIADARAGYRRASRSPNLEIVGVSCHIGSQLTTLDPFEDALKRILRLVADLEGEGIKLGYLDMGGGLGIRYKDEDPPPPARYAAALAALVKPARVTLVIEPGRAIVGNAGVMLTRVLYRKNSSGRDFIVVDGGMNDLVRPTLYGAYQEILTVRTPAPERVKVDVVGPVCESGDFLARERELPPLCEGDLLAVLGAGAYGFSMASNYNARRRPAEVMVQGESFRVVRQRETYLDLVRGESPLSSERRGNE